MDLTSELIKKHIVEELNFVSAIVSVDKDEIYRQYSYLTEDDFFKLECKKFWKKFLECRDTAPAMRDMPGLLVDILKLEHTPISYRHDVFAEAMGKIKRMIDYSAEIGVLAKACADDNIEDADQAIEKLSLIKGNGNGGGKCNALNTVDIAFDFIDTLDNSWEVIRTGIPKLDGALGGLLIGELSVLASRTSIGKTALAWQIARNVSSSGKKVLYVSNEMRARVLWARAAGGVAAVDMRKMMNGTLSPEERERLEQASADLMGVHSATLWIDEKSLSIPKIYQSVREIEPKFVVLDHLDEFPMPRGMDSKVMWLGEIITRMHGIAREFDCHVMVIHQLSRAVENRQDHTPILADLRWSGDVEQKADTVLMLHRPDLYDETIDQSLALISKAEIWVRKHRIGMRDTLVNLDYDLRRQWFSDKSLP